MVQAWPRDCMYPRPWDLVSYSSVTITLFSLARFKSSLIFNHMYFFSLIGIAINPKSLIILLNNSLSQWLLSPSPLVHKSDYLKVATNDLRHVISFSNPLNLSPQLWPFMLIIWTLYRCHHMLPPIPPPNLYTVKVNSLSTMSIRL